MLVRLADDGDAGVVEMRVFASGTIWFSASPGSLFATRPRPLRPEVAAVEKCDEAREADLDRIADEWPHRFTDAAQ